MLDKIVCPRCGHFPLSVEIEEERQGIALDADIRPCALYCAHEERWLRNLSAEPPCDGCLRRSIISGELDCPDCGGRFPIDGRIANLLPSEAVSEWVKGEKEWWERKYARIEEEYDVCAKYDGDRDNEKREIAGNRWYEREMYLFDPLRRRGVRGTLIVEIGAGTSMYIAGLLHLSDDRCFYIGTDVSRRALQIGSKLIPEGDFIQCAVGKMPFRKEAIDTVLSLGVLHHVPSWQSSLNRLLDLLKPGGWLLFNEGILKPRILGRLRKQSLTTAIDSPHEGKIMLQELLEILEMDGRLVMYRVETTPLRVVLVWLLGPAMERSILITKVVLALDRLFLKSLGKYFKALGPGETIGVFEKGI